MNESVFSVVTDATLTRFAADANWSSFRTLRCSLWRRAHGSVRSEDRDPETDAAWRPREVAALPPDSPNFLLAEVRRVAFAPAEVAAQMDRCGIGEKLGAQLDAFVYGLSERASELLNARCTCCWEAGGDDAEALLEDRICDFCAVANSRLPQGISATFLSIAKVNCVVVDVAPG